MDCGCEVYINKYDKRITGQVFCARHLEEVNKVD